MIRKPNIQQIPSAPAMVCDTCSKRIKLREKFYFTAYGACRRCEGCYTITQRRVEGWSNTTALLMYSPEELEALRTPRCYDCDSDLDRVTSDLWGCRSCYKHGCTCFLCAPCAFCESLVCI